MLDNSLYSSIHYFTEMARLIDKLSDYAKGKSVYLSDLGSTIEIPSEVLKKLYYIQSLTKNDGREGT